MRWIPKWVLSLAVAVCAAQEPPAAQVVGHPAFDVVSIKLRKDAVNFIQGHTSKAELS